MDTWTIVTIIGIEYSWHCRSQLLSMQHGLSSKIHYKRCEKFLWSIFSGLTPTLLLFSRLRQKNCRIGLRSLSFDTTLQIWRGLGQQGQFIACTYKNLENYSGTLRRIMCAITILEKGENWPKHSKLASTGDYENAPSTCDWRIH